MTHEMRDLVGKLTNDMAILLNQSLEEVRSQYLKKT
jgi:hypothetical protein